MAARLVLRGCRSAGLLLLPFLLSVSGPRAVADPAPDDAASPLRRDVIGLYRVPPDADTPHPEIENPIHQLLEMPLEHLGFRVHGLDVADGPPDDALLARTAVVATWLDDDAPAPAWLIPWLARAAAGGRHRLLHLGRLPVAAEGQAEIHAAYLSALGLVASDAYASGAGRVDVRLVGGAACRHEADPRREARHEGVRSTDERHDIWVETRDRLAPDEVLSPVLVAPWGGLALEPYAARIGTADDDRRWHVDPFAFLPRALALAPRPVLDPCVRWGRRVFTFHVDGDGFESISVVDRGVLCGAVFGTHVLDRYPVPTTLSVIVASLAPSLAPDEPTTRMEVARQLLARPWVEIASHGVLHPYDWNLPWGPSPEARKNFAYAALEGYTYAPAAEVRESLAFIRTHLAPADKPVRGMLWTGMSVAPVEALDAAAEDGGWNLNGGTYRYDAAYDSMGYVTPFGRRIAGRYQVHAAAANENEFPGFFDRSPGAFGHVATTIERTGSPRILKPASIYAHFYSAERPARLAALQGLLQRFALDEPTIPVLASTWVAAVHGFQRGEIETTADGWRVTGHGACRTVRFDGEARDVDVRRSTGVVGQARIGDALYVALAKGPATIVLAMDAAPHPHIVASNHELADVDLGAAHIAFRGTSRTPRTVVVGGLPADTRVSVRVGDAVRTRETDGAGRLALALAPNAPAAVRVSVP